MKKKRSKAAAREAMATEKARKRVVFGPIAAVVGLALVAVDTSTPNEPRPGFAILGMLLTLGGLVFAIYGLHAFGRLGADTSRRAV